VILSTEKNSLILQTKREKQKNKARDGGGNLREWCMKIASFEQLAKSHAAAFLADIYWSVFISNYTQMAKAVFHQVPAGTEYSAFECL
jgi:hypothetical protein